MTRAGMKVGHSIKQFSTRSSGASWRSLNREKIILFGSAVHGEMGRHSDVDLLVVKDGVDRRRTAARIYRASTAWVQRWT